METNRSHRKTFNLAHKLGSRLFKPYAHPCSRHDFTEPQLFACLVLRELLRMSYRKVEVFLVDSPDWCADIGMSGVPDHNTLWRAFGRLIKAGRMNRAFDLLAKLQSAKNRDSPSLRSLCEKQGQSLIKVARSHGPLNDLPSLPRWPAEEVE
jgi:hypothetical protein